MSARRVEYDAPIGGGTSDESALEELVRDQAEAIALYRKMFERTSAMAKIGVWECDLGDESLTWSDAVYDLFELPRGSPLDRARIVEMYEPESRREMEVERQRAIEDGSGFSIDVQVSTAKGNARWIRLTAGVEMEDGEAVRIFGIKQDISEEKAAQRELQQLQTEFIHLSRRSAMAAMADTLAHELNQPLAAIANYVAGTRRALEQGDGKLVKAGFDAIEHSALKAGEIIRSLRAMTSGRPTRREAIDPGPLIREAGSLGMVGAGPDVTLIFELIKGARLRIDAIQIQQVIINLIRNAVAAVREAKRPEIKVRTAYGEQSLVISVEDNGTGIADEVLPSLFDSFVSTKPDGSGIGLSISRSIVESHEGRIFAANRPEGGALFTVVLPLARGGRKADRARPGR
jgi:PAS domain S-box-containing protein